jgi:Acyl-coenzyme A:6-aminopenicillanic acid acyl-transferase
MKRLFVLLLLLAGAGMTGDIWSCTTFIISGKNTPDGKPILYKNRDTGTLDNAIVFFSDGKYQYIGIVDSRESWKKEVWGGFNSAGFAIMNSMAYNNNVGDTTKFEDQEGVVMKLALASCATLADFEKLLTDLPKPLGVNSNFGVIDASGGAAYYETGNYGFNKIDANDPALAPFGYLIRTNHSFTGAVDEGMGYIRYAAASEALNMAVAQNRLEPQYLLNNISRNLNHSLTKANLRADLPLDNKSPEFRHFEDFIPRFSTASVIMVVGAAKGEDPAAAMAWMVDGSPLTAVAVPVWVSAGRELPAVVSMKDDMHSPLCDAAMQLKGQLFPITRGNGNKYINVAALLNAEKTGILQRLEPVENEIFRKTAGLTTALTGKKTDKAIIQEHYKWIDSYIIRSYKEIFDIEIK